MISESFVYLYELLYHFFMNIMFALKSPGKALFYVCEDCPKFYQKILCYCSKFTSGKNIAHVLESIFFFLHPNILRCIKTIF